MVNKKRLLSIMVSLAVFSSNLTVLQAQENVDGAVSGGDMYAAGSQSQDVSGGSVSGNQTGNILTGNPLWLSAGVDNPYEYYDVWWDFEDGKVWDMAKAGKEVSGSYDQAMTHTLETEGSGNRYMKAAGNKEKAWRASMYKLPEAEMTGAEIVFDLKPIKTDEASRYGDIMFMSSVDNYSYFNITFNKNLELFYYNTPGVNYTADLFSGIKMDGTIFTGSNDDRVAALKGTGLTGDGDTWFQVKVIFDYVGHTADLSITDKSDPTKSFTENGIQIRSGIVDLNRVLLTAFKSLPEMGIDNFGVKFLTDVDPSVYYSTYWNDFEDSIWENVAIGNDVIAEGGSSGATLSQKSGADGNNYMNVTGNKAGGYRVSKLSLPQEALSGADITFDWLPVSAQDNASRFGDVAFLSSGSTYPYFGLQFDKDKKIKYYTIGENVASGYGLTYSEEELGGGYKRDSAADSGTAKDTGITADGSTWYTVKLSFDYEQHTADLLISKRDEPDTALYQESGIPIYASAVNPSSISAGCWKGIIEMGLDNMGVKYSYSTGNTIVSLVQPENVMVTAADWEQHKEQRPVKAIAAMGDGSEREFEIGEWTSEPGFEADKYMEYVWSAQLVIPEGSGIRNPKNLALTYRMNYVKGYLAKGAYDPTTLELEYGSVSSVDEFEVLRPTETQVVLSNGKVAKMPLDPQSWEAVLNKLPESYIPDEENHPVLDTAPEFDPEKEGIYIYKAKLMESDEYGVDGDIWVEWRVNYFSADENFNGYQRTIESLDRGLYAIRNVVYDQASGTYAESAEGGIYLSWRILVDEYALVQKGKNIVFTVYRNGQEIISLENETDYLDKEGIVGDVYTVKAAQDGIYSFSGDVNALEDNYISIKLQRPLPSYSVTDNFAAYRLNDTEVADVDGDGAYEVIVKWYPTNGFDPGIKGSNRTSSPHIIDVYEMDGTALWRLYMGYSSPAGQHFDSFIVYDMDQDGKAELAILTQDGTRTYRPDENGQFVYLTAEEGGYVFQPDDPANSEGTGRYIPSADGNGYMLSNGAGYDFTYVGNNGSPMMDDRYLVDVVGEISREGVGIASDGYKTKEVKEYFTVFNGSTGEIIDTVDYVYSTRFFQEETENKENSTVMRWNIGLAYIPEDIADSGCTSTIPAVLCNRAYYSDVSMIAYTLVDGRIKTSWQTYIPTASNGGGNHNMVTGDMDNDGFDEVYLGGTAIDHDGTVLWAKNGFDNMDFMKHGDMIHMTAVFPDSDQLYCFTPVEDGSVSVVLNYALSNAATGARIVGHTFGKADTGRGMLANVTPYPGYELWASNPASDAQGRYTRALYNAYGEVVNENRPAVQTWSSYWDGDLLSELPDSNPSGGGDKSGLPMGVHKYNWETGETENIASFAGTLTNNSTKNNPNLTADILGDWREEILVRAADNEELRIYMTNIPTDYTIYTLMQDSVYRNSVAGQNGTYNQPAHTSFYLGEDETGRDRVRGFGLPTYNYVYAQDTVEKYTDVDFVSNGGTSVDTLTQVKLGGTIQAPEGMLLENYQLEGWYRDAEFKEKWDFTNDTVNGRTTLYARWVKDSEDPGPDPEPTPDPGPAPDPDDGGNGGTGDNGNSGDDNVNSGQDGKKDQVSQQPVGDRTSPKTYDDSNAGQGTSRAGTAALAAQPFGSTDEFGWVIPAAGAAVAVLMIWGIHIYRKRKDEE